ncbi:MAG: hypothetical protein H6774_01515 [Pseudomonadales bacterium]|nr:hypothetical protein [Pseudomonadales bacterium]
MFARLLTLFGIVCGICIASVSPVFAQACEDVVCSGSQQEQKLCIQNKISCLESRLEEEKNKKASFTSAINVLNGQLSIQELEVQQTQAEVSFLESQIADLSTKIEGLDISLDRLTTIMMERVQAQYKRARISPLALLVDANSFHEFISTYEYSSRASQQTVEAMQQAEMQKQEYNAQKDLKEEKQLEIEQKRQELQSQQNELNAQKAQQEQFLAQTQSNEQRFQELLAESNRQLSAFSRFVSNQGGASILTNQTICNEWGCYYSQRDAQWGRMGIGRSSSSMAEYGCLVTSMAMLASHLGRNITPASIAISTNPFYYNTAFMIQGTWTAGGVTMNRTRVGYNYRAVDTELAAGRSPIVGIGSGPDHFLVITKKENGIYYMHDPFMPNGHDVSFTSRYSLGSISAVDRVTVL